MYNTRNIGVYECGVDGVIINTWSSITAAAKHIKMCRHKLASIIDKNIVQEKRIKISTYGIRGVIFTLLFAYVLACYLK
jgi:hypothetical protein